MEYERIIARLIKEDRPPGSGVMTDQDYTVARAVYPPNTGNPEQIATLLRDLAKRRRDGAKTDLARASAAKTGVSGMTTEQLRALNAELLAEEGESSAFD
jgi:hypothetical protein